MGANAQTSVPAFTAGQVLTAQQQTEINTGVPVFADATARDAAFGGTGEKTLAEGQLAYLEDSNVVQYYDGSVWATVGPATAGGLELVSTTTIGSAVSTVTVTGAFSATYDAYKITVTGGAGSTTANIQMQMGSTANSHYWIEGNFIIATGAASANTGSNQANMRVGFMTANGIYVSGDLYSPFLSEETFWHGGNAATSFTTALGITSGSVNTTTSYTAFTLTCTSGTMTGGEIRVYGYKN